MSTLKKTIQVNPELFKMGGNKTRKAGKADKVVVPKPLISPNSVKNKLLNRLQERKKAEIKHNLGVKPHILLETNTDLDSSNNDNKENDEFFNALSYLTDFKKKQQVDNEKKRYEEKKRQDLLNKTIKNQYSGLGLTPEFNISSGSVPINLELDPNLAFDSSLPSLPIHKYKIDNDVATGCLKNGYKPTYKSMLNQTKRNTPVINIPDVLTVNSNTTSLINNVNIDRQKKLEMIKAKIKNLEEDNKPINTIKESLIPDPNIVVTTINETLKDLKKSNVAKVIEEKQQEEQSAGKKYLKKTVKRKFTLGKSNIYRKVGILVGNKQSRKNVIEAQKELKRTSMSDIKKYLKHHGLIKVGSTASNDVLRKMYECAIMAGEITNINKDTMIHNFLNEDTNK